MFDLNRGSETEETGRRSLLGLAEPDRPAPGGAPETEPPAPAGRSMLGLEPPLPRSAAAGSRDSASATGEAEPLREIFDLERKADRQFPVERAILFSIAAHILILILFMNAPDWTPREADARKGLLAAFMPPEKTDEEKIPIIFKEAPGPSRANPRRADPSDATRRAGGGDPTKGRSETPFVPPRKGVEGLEPGSRAAASAARQAPRTGTASEKSPEAAPGEKQAAAPDAFRVAPPGPQSSGRESQQLAGLSHAIQEAAKGVGANSHPDGAGFPNPEGGFVDSGPISFDTTWYDWGAYAEEMIRRIKLHWDIPELARLGWKGKLTVRFFIRGDGRVEDARIIKVSGVPPFDFAALQSILTSSPFRPLPKDLGSDREGVTVTFFYNIRPGKGGDQEAR